MCSTVVIVTGFKTCFVVPRPKERVPRIYSRLCHTCSYRSPSQAHLFGSWFEARLNPVFCWSLKTALSWTPHSDQFVEWRPKPNQLLSQQNWNKMQLRTEYSSLSGPWSGFYWLVLSPYACGFGSSCISMMAVGIAPPSNSLTLFLGMLALSCPYIP